MTTASNIMTGLVAALHIYFLVLEMFLWDKAAGRKAFGLTVAQAKSTKVMAANQGLYNGFLAAGLIWSLLLSNSGQHIQTFFLFCVLIAGIYGAMTARKKYYSYKRYLRQLHCSCYSLQNKYWAFT